MRKEENVVFFIYMENLIAYPEWNMRLSRITNAGGWWGVVNMVGGLHFNRVRFCVCERSKRTY